MDYFTFCTNLLFTRLGVDAVVFRGVGCCQNTIRSDIITWKQVREKSKCRGTCWLLDCLDRSEILFSFLKSAMWGDGGCIVSIFIWGFRLRLDRKLQEAVQTGSGLQYRLDRKWSEYRLGRKWSWLCIKGNHRQRIFSIKQFIWIWIFLYISAIVFLWLCRLMGRTRYHTYFFWEKRKCFHRFQGFFTYT